jgi:large subunit ribosomal protein L24
MMKIKKGDNVEVVSGKDAGKRGRVLVVDRDKQRVVVEGVNMIKRHTRPNPQKKIQGGIVEREAAIHASNVMVVSPDSGRPTRVGYTTLDNGRKVRVSKVDGAILDR